MVLSSPIPQKTSNAQTTLHFRCFGIFSFLGDHGWEVGPPLKRGREFLEYLATHARSMVAHGTLADAFWPNIDTDTVGHRLHLAVSGARAALRQASGAFNPIRCANGAYGWHPSIIVRSDAMRFDECYNNCSPEAALEGVNLYAGEFLAGEEKDWIIPIRLRYASAYVAMLEYLAAEATRRGDHQTALRHALQLVETDRSHEGAARLSMCCLGRLGCRALALAQYEQLRSYLKMHLGVKPTEETEQLRSRILKGEPD